MHCDIAGGEPDRLFGCYRWTADGPLAAAAAVSGSLVARRTNRQTPASGPPPCHLGYILIATCVLFPSILRSIFIRSF